MATTLNERNSIVCDQEACKGVFYPEDIRRQEEEITTDKYVGLKRSFFLCPHCGHKYTIDVSDLPMRLKIREYKSLVKKQRGLLQSKAGEQRLRNNLVKLEKVSKEIVEKGNMLKEEWK